MYLKHRLLQGSLYFLQAKGADSLHSPFVFSFQQQVLSKKNSRLDFKDITKLRFYYKQQKSTITKNDLGAGNQKKVLLKQLAKTSSIRHKYGRVLFNIAQWLQVQSILEFGSCLGVSSLYLNAAMPNSKLISIEGDEQTYNEQQKAFTHLGIAKSATFINTKFEQYLRQLDSDTKFDLIFIDGNHTYDATIEYFERLKKHIHTNSIIIFDDIYWSPEMTKAWHYIQKDRSVTSTIDIYQLGIVAFRQQAKENFVIRY